MAVNKVIYNGNTLIDLTAVTVTADVLLDGYTAYDASGNLITGTYADEWSETPSDTIISVRSFLYYDTSTGTIEMQNSNTEAVIMSQTENNYSFVDRNSNTVYLLPLDARAKKATVNYTGSSTVETYRFQGFHDDGGTFTRVFDSGKISTAEYSFDNGVADYVSVSMELPDSVKWGWSDTQVATVTFF